MPVKHGNQRNNENIIGSEYYFFLYNQCDGNGHGIIDAGLFNVNNVNMFIFMLVLISNVKSHVNI